MKVRFWNYGVYSSDNYGVHSLAFEDANGNCYWFSYDTLVAFQKCGYKRYVHTNDWGTTTGNILIGLMVVIRKIGCQVKSLRENSMKFLEMKKH